MRSPYLHLGCGRSWSRFDAVALDNSGDVVAAVEAERSNNDLLDAVPEDYDKLAAVDPEVAIWIVENRDGDHAVLNALNNPKDGVQKRAAMTSSSGVGCPVTLLAATGYERYVL